MRGLKNKRKFSVGQRQRFFPALMDCTIFFRAFYFGHFKILKNGYFKVGSSPIVDIASVHVEDVPLVRYCYDEWSDD